MEVLLGLLFGLSIVLFLWGLVDVIKSINNGQLKAGNWIMIFLLIPIAGPLLYFQLKDRR